MAREESNREDILREATALVERAEIQLAGLAESTVLGFRRDGCFSLYFQPDEVYHFNTQRELRRAYVRGELIKAEERRLVGLTRQRNPDGVALVRREFSAEQQAQFLQKVGQVVLRLGEQISDRELEVIAQVGHENVIDKLRKWTLKFPLQMDVAARPHAE